MIPDPNELLNEDNEIVVRLEGGFTLRSGSDSDAFVSGSYVRLCDKEGKELFYWSKDEWQEDPELVMGAIINMAAYHTS